MDEQLKRRLVGASVLVALAVIFLPMLLERQPTNLKPAPVQAIPKEPPHHFKPVTRPAERHRVVKKAPKQAEKPKSTAKSFKPQPSKPKKAVVHPKEKSPAKQAPASPSAWAVRVASLGSREKALELVKKLRKAGLDTMEPQLVTVKGKKYYRVLVGPEAAKKNAEKHQALIQKLTGGSGQVVRYP